MFEVELKFQVPPAARAAVDAAVAGRGGSTRQRLVAQYVDTPEHLLAGAGIALRLRREGRRWVQTLKAAGDDGLTRLEHNVERGSAAAAPALDPALHTGTPAGDRLEALLAAHPDAVLATQFATDVRRRARRLRKPGAVLELCADEGKLVTGDRHAPVHELEIELVDGRAGVLIDEARRWVARHGLVLDMRSKAERGDLLARAEAMAPARSAKAVSLAARLPLAGAARAVLRSCAEQVLANASQVGTGVHAPEHVHQLRVGLRRLRTALQLFAPAQGELALLDATLAEGAAEFFRTLGAVRDRDVLHGQVGVALDAAWRTAGGAGSIVPPALAPAANAAALVAAPATQQFLLSLLAAGLEPAAGDADEPRPLARWMAERIARWHRRAAREARSWQHLDEAGRHALRKRIKRLRYATEFSASLFDAAAVRRYLQPLRALQERLGELNDIAMAEAACRALRDADAADTRAWFALGWLRARRDSLLAQMPPVLEAFADARRYWKK